LFVFLFNCSIAYQKQTQTSQIKQTNQPENQQTSRRTSQKENEQKKQHTKSPTNQRKQKV
jgi:hypothetical protein